MGPPPPMLELFTVTLASLFAGFIDAIVGGGGLILIPALFSVFPTAPPPALLGTNKGAAIWGTAWSSVQFSRRVQLPWGALAPAAVAALAGGLAGAWAVTQVSPHGLRRALPFILLAVLLYTLARKDLGRTHAPQHVGVRQAALASGIGVVLGFYDGFFGPGTGSFFVFLFVRLLGFDFLHASASAKLLNSATNFASLVLFALKGHVWWHIALVMALANVLGSLLGTRLALKHGAGFVRGVFIVVVGALIVKTGYDAFLRS
ncbi:TSUP family transporter [Piscinibacter sp. XHJ-5]|uniref:TSUP family transporter n=1 Tax=Piscinibacter sp. XHJ-5 TaxID=3037797 RepID=UPI0024536F7E|nr:TSUP family transporter [Piscinibacter sp. XHJ-5]